MKDEVQKNNKSTLILNGTFLSKLIPIIVFIFFIVVSVLSFRGVSILNQFLEQHERVHSFLHGKTGNIYVSIGNAIQESYAYLAKGEIAEREEFIQWSERFPLIIDQYYKDSQNIPYEEEIESTLEKIKDAHYILNMHALNMFSEFDQYEEITLDTYQKYEHAIDTIIPLMGILFELESKSIHSFDDQLEGVFERGKSSIQLTTATLLVIAALFALFAGWLVMRLRAQAEDYLHEQIEHQRREQLVLDSIPAMIWQKDNKNNIINLNAAAAKSSGKSVEEIRGMSTRQLYPMHADDYYEDDLEVINSNKPKLNIIEPHQTKDELQWVRTDKYPYLDEDGINKGVLVIATDITKQKKTELALERSEAMLADAERIANLGSWELDIVNDSLIWSDEVYRIFGIIKDQVDVSYEKFLEIVHPDDRDMVNEAYRSSLENKSPYNITHRLIMSDGSIKFVNERCKTYFDDDGYPLRSIGSVQDITSIKELESKNVRARSLLAHTERLNTLGELSASIAHELNQPLSSINQFCSSAILRLKKLNINDERLNEYIDMSLAQAKRGGEIIRRLRNLVKKKPSLKERCNINNLISECILLLQSDLELEGINLILSLKKDIPPAELDKIQIEQVIINLIRNSMASMVKDLQNNPYIEIVSEIDDDNCITVSVMDNGPGWQFESENDLFDAFTSGNGEGLGLGLSISKSIIEAHNGKIWIDRDYKNGAAIKFSIPLLEHI